MIILKFNLLLNEAPDNHKNTYAEQQRYFITEFALEILIEEFKLLQMLTQNTHVR